MAESRGSVLHQQALVVMALFTGLTLTSLVLILNSSGSFRVPFGPLSGQQYFEVVTTYVAVVGVVSSVAVVAYMEVAGGLSSTFSFVDKFGTTLFFLSIFGFIGMLPLLLAPFTRLGALAVLILGILLLGTYFFGRRVPDWDPRAGRTYQRRTK
jgi:hypothetical protein